MTEPYTLIPSLAETVACPDDGILSKPIFTNDLMRVTLFALSAGQELTEHTTTMEALLQFIEGEAEITLGADTHQAGPGAWMRMEPNLKHSIKARTPLKMMLVVLRESKAAPG